MTSGCDCFCDAAATQSRKSEKQNENWSTTKLCVFSCLIFNRPIKYSPGDLVKLCW